MGLQETSIIFQNIRYRHYYLCHYLPLTSGIDAVSRSLLKFKRGAQPDLDNWLDRALCFLRESPVSLPPDTIIVRALHHKETSPPQDQPTSLDLLGQALSGHFRLSYQPALLHKTRPTNTVQGLTRSQRQAELQDVYFINTNAFIPAPSSANPSTPAPSAPTTITPAPSSAALTPPASILLIDDILTTGTTIRMIIQALTTSFPTCSIRIFTLAKCA